MRKLEKLGVKVCGTSEDFGTSKGGIWVSLEEGLLSEFMHGCHGDDYYNSKICKVIEENSAYLESYDYGTAMIWGN